MLNILVPAVLTVIDKIFPDANAAAAAKLELFKLQQTGELKQLEADVQLAAGQLGINQVEAAHPSIFVSGWRPAVGWVCVTGLTYSFLGYPLISWLSTMIDVPVPPDLDLGALITLLGGMLGLGSLRTLEKIKRVDRK